MELADGIGFIGMTMGVFGITEIISNLELKSTREVFTKTIEHLMPSREDFRRMWKSIVRGTLFGIGLGVLPGGGTILSSFGAYALEKKLSRHGHEFGKGAIEGVAAPEAANNASSQACFIPMLTLGIPSTVVMALMIGALMIQGIAPGPQIMVQMPELFWGLIASMWIGNAMLVILNLPLIGIWVRLLTVPYRLLYPSILAFMGIGVYGTSNSPFDVLLMVVWGIMGVIFVKLECEPAPLILGMVLGPMLEENLRRSLMISHGDPIIFVNRPISAGFLIAAFLLLFVILAPNIRKKREEIFVED
jgi:TctA family transporter